MSWLLNNWRVSLHKNMKSKPFCDALKDVPRRVDKSDWEWLVKEHFLSEKFKGGKDGKPPNMDTIFFETHKKDNKLVEPKKNAKYVEIQKLVQSDSSLTNIEVVHKCFEPQCKSHVVGFGCGITAKKLKGGNSSKAALLDKLNARDKENESLKRCMDELEYKCEHMDELEYKYEQLARVVFG